MPPTEKPLKCISVIAFLMYKLGSSPELSLWCLSIKLRVPPSSNPALLSNSADAVAWSPNLACDAFPWSCTNASIIFLALIPTSLLPSFFLHCRLKFLSLKRGGEKNSPSNFSFFSYCSFCPIFCLADIFFSSARDTQTRHARIRRN